MTIRQTNNQYSTLLKENLSNKYSHTDACSAYREDLIWGRNETTKLIKINFIKDTGIINKIIERANQCVAN